MLLDIGCDVCMGLALLLALIWMIWDMADVARNGQWRKRQEEDDHAVPHL